MEYIAECNKNLASYKRLIERTDTFEVKGIFHSEMLLFCSVVSALGATHLIESGRARGQSTEIIARFVSDNNDLQFDSIEFDRNSPDVDVAAARLSSLTRWVNLYFGDAYILLPKLLCGKKSVVLIDGPKGPWALGLALKAFEHEEVAGVFIHDVHRDAVDVRPIIEKHFQGCFFTDDDRYLKDFQTLDDDCWEALVRCPGYEGWAPYRRGRKIMKSYSATLGFIPAPFGLSDDCISEIHKEIDKDISVESSLNNKIIRKIKKMIHL
jgi:hypothetical protein